MIRNFIKKIIFPKTFSSERYIQYLRSIGCEIGEGTIIWSPNQTYIDETRPYLIEIGSYCKITRGVTILAHDYSRSVLRKVYGENIGEAQKTVIGNNCFIGNNAIILMGSCIGDNCIVGAGSVVTKNFPNNVVIGGNPARIICSLDEYYEKRKKLTVFEAKSYAKILYKKKNKKPTIEEMGNAFSWLYLPRDEDTCNRYKKFFELSGDDEKDIMKNFLVSEPIYRNFEDFLEDCNLEEE